MIFMMTCCKVCLLNAVHAYMKDSRVIRQPGLSPLKDTKGRRKAMRGTMTVKSRTLRAEVGVCSEWVQVIKVGCEGCNGCKAEKRVGGTDKCTWVRRCVMVH